MKLTLVRHTSVDVPKGICYGITDVPLAPSFQYELEKIRQKIENNSFDTIYSSPLSRCTILASSLFPEVEIGIDNRLKEFNFGDWEMADWNTLFESEAGKTWFADYVNTRCPNGESFSDQIERARSFLAHVKSISANHILVFTHAGILRAMMCLLQDKTPVEAFTTPLEYGQIITLNFPG